MQIRSTLSADKGKTQTIEIELIETGDYYLSFQDYQNDAQSAQPYELETFLALELAKDVSIDFDIFNPMNEEECTISYNLLEELPISLKIYNSEDQLVRTLIDNEIMSVGVHNINWDGKDDSGKMVPDGGYVFTIETMGTQGMRYWYDGSETGMKNISGRAYISSIKPVASDNPFYSPLLIKYYTPEDAFITMRIRQERFSGPLLATIKSFEPHRAGNYEVIWDGRDDFGNLLPSGEYNFALWAYTFPENLMVITGNTPKISNVKADPMFIETDKITNISYTLSKDANVEVIVYNENNIAVKTLLSQNQLAGEHSITWDGRNDTGLLLTDGNYRIDIQAYDTIGNYSEIMTAVVVIKY